MLDRGKDPLPLLYTFSSSAVVLLPYLQYYQKCEPMILKVWVKSKFVLRQQRHYDWLKIIRNVTFSKYSFFENVLLLSISRNSLQTPSLDDKPLRNVTLSNSIISIRNLIRWKRDLEIFLIDQCWWYWK